MPFQEYAHLSPLKGFIAIIMCLDMQGHGQCGAGAEICAALPPMERLGCSTAKCSVAAPQREQRERGCKTQ